MSELSEEEIIRRLTETKKYDLYYIIREFKRNGIDNYIIAKKKLIQGLLDLYQKEKEKNKELEDKIKRKIKIRKEEKAECKDSIEANLILREIYVLEELLEERN